MKEKTLSLKSTYKKVFNGMMSPTEVPEYIFQVKRIVSYRFKKIRMSFKYT